MLLIFMLLFLWLLLLLFLVVLCRFLEEFGKHGEEASTTIKFDRFFFLLSQQLTINEKEVSFLASFFFLISGNGTDDDGDDGCVMERTWSWELGDSMDGDGRVWGLDNWPYDMRLGLLWLMATSKKVGTHKGKKFAKWLGQVYFFIFYLLAFLN